MKRAEKRTERHMHRQTYMIANLSIARNLLRATCCAGVNPALRSLLSAPHWVSSSTLPGGPKKLHNEICSRYPSKQRNKQCKTHKSVQIHSETVFNVSSLLLDDTTHSSRWRHSLMARSVKHYDSLLNHSVMTARLSCLTAVNRLRRSRK